MAGSLDQTHQRRDLAVIPPDLRCNEEVPLDQRSALDLLQVLRANASEARDADSLSAPALPEESSEFMAGYVSGLSHAHTASLQMLTRQGATTEAVRRSQQELASLSGRLNDLEQRLSSGTGVLHMLASRVNRLERGERTSARVQFFTLGRLEQLSHSVLSQQSAGSPYAVLLGALGPLQSMANRVLAHLHVSWLAPVLYRGTSYRHLTLKQFIRYATLTISVEVASKTPRLIIPRAVRTWIRLLRLILWWGALMTFWRNAVEIGEKVGDTAAQKRKAQDPKGESVGAGVDGPAAADAGAPSSPISHEASESSSEQLLDQSVEEETQTEEPVLVYM